MLGRQPASHKVNANFARPRDRVNYLHLSKGLAFEEVHLRNAFMSSLLKIGDAWPKALDRKLPFSVCDKQRQSPAPSTSTSGQEQTSKTLRLCAASTIGYGSVATISQWN